MQKNLAQTYTARQASFTAEAEALRKKYDRFSIVRLLVFFGSLGLIVLLATVHFIAAAIGVLLFFGGFYRLMKWHQKMLADAKHAERMAAINGEEKRALNHDFSVFPNGKNFLDIHHPYALDLDIFGKHSIFQYFCRATSFIGQERLAEYLSTPVEISEIESRQAAISELNPMLDWRQHFRAFGAKVKDDPRHIQLLHDWLADEDVVRGNGLYLTAIWLAVPWFLVCVGLSIFFLPWQLAAIIFAIPPGYFLKKTKEQIDRTHLRTTHAGEMLSQYGRLLQSIENQQFKDKKLIKLKKPLIENGHSAAAEIERLAYIIRQLNMRFNFFAIFLNFITLWDLKWVNRLEKWKAEMEGQLSVWFDSLKEFEALCSLANAWHNNPEWSLPQLSQKSKFEGKNLAHPLLLPDQRIGNDLTMPPRGHIKLVTGSNMAGKSTFLRTVGLNIVLAQSGSAVCADSLSLPPLQVWTSMRTVDDLSESTSSFFAELKRLKVIIEAVEKADSDRSSLPVFFLLDEILKGTNSVDRHTGSAALIRQLIQQRGGGIIATHDLELGRLEAEAKGAIENLCMEVQVKGGELIFDYTLRPGVSESFNATLLMKRMGIRISESE